jgi:hypothetical protein
MDPQAVDTSVSAGGDTSQRSRDPYAEVGAATRASNAAARAADPPLNATQLHVLLAVQDHLSTYSRLEDLITSRQLSAGTHLTRGPISRSLARLKEVGAIRYEPRSGGQKSFIGLPFPFETSRDLERATNADQVARLRPRDGRATKSARRSRDYGARAHNEKFSEKSFREIPYGSQGDRAKEILQEAIEPGSDLPEDYVAHLGKRTKDLLAEGQDPELVAAAVGACIERGKHPSLLPSLVVELQAKGPKDITRSVVPLEESWYERMRLRDEAYEQELRETGMLL